MRRTAGAAILPVDGFTGLPITDGTAFIRSPDGKRNVKKPDGYYVFWDDGEPFLRLSAGGEIYRRKDFILSLDMLRNRSLPSFSVYLFPSKRYPFPPGIRWERGREKIVSGSPYIIRNATVYFPEHSAQDQDVYGSAPWIASENAVRLTRDVLPGDTSICLKAGGSLILEDRTLYLGRRGEEELISVNLGEASDTYKGEYALLRPFPFTLKISETNVYFDYEGEIQEDGCIPTPYFIDK